MSKRASKRTRSLHLVVLAAVAMFIFAAVPTMGGAAPSNPSADLDQCRNDMDNNEVKNPCGTADVNGRWLNGNLGETNALFFEGDSVPFRAKFEGLVIGDTYVFTIQYDFKQGDHYAYDYLTGWDVANGGSETGDICGEDKPPTTCHPITDQEPIPLNPDAAADASAGFVQEPGDMKCYGCTITSIVDVTPETVSGSNKEDAVIVTFVATATDPFLSWGGHLAEDPEYPAADDGSASVSGAPYHMRMLNITCAGADADPATTADNQDPCNVGNQDRSIKSQAIIEPPALAVTTQTLRATRYGKTIVLRWRTASEVDTLGFQVYRLVRGHRVKVSKRIIPAASLVNSRSANAYSFRARLGSRRIAAASRFLLAEVHYDGRRTWYGPVRAAAAS